MQKQKLVSKEVLQFKSDSNEGLKLQHKAMKLLTDERYKKAWSKVMFLKKTNSASLVIYQHQGAHGPKVSAPPGLNPLNVTQIKMYKPRRHSK